MINIKRRLEKKKKHVSQAGSLGYSSKSIPVWATFTTTARLSYIFYFLLFFPLSIFRTKRFEYDISTGTSSRVCRVRKCYIWYEDVILKEKKKKNDGCVQQRLKIFLVLRPSVLHILNFHIYAFLGSPRREMRARARGFVRRSGLMSMTRATRFIILFFPHSSAERFGKHLLSRLRFPNEFIT